MSLWSSLVELDDRLIACRLSSLCHVGLRNRIISSSSVSMSVSTTPGGATIPSVSAYPLPAPHSVGNIRLHQTVDFPESLAQSSTLQHEIREVPSIESVHRFEDGHQLLPANNSPISPISVSKRAVGVKNH